MIFLLLIKTSHLSIFYSGIYLLNMRVCFTLLSWKLQKLLKTYRYIKVSPCLHWFLFWLVAIHKKKILYGNATYRVSYSKIILLLLPIIIIINKCNILISMYLRMGNK